MKATIKGKVMGKTTRQYKDREGVTRYNELIQIYQEGEKNLIEIQGVDPKSVVEGETIEIDCVVYSWSTTKGAHGLNIKMALV